jgi:YbgC/YbaW family acyl-CoA thioester hydrolase
MTEGTVFIYRTQIRLKDTDATGVLYFSEQFKFALEAFEEFLKERGFSFRELTKSPFLLPVVHAEADYKVPMMVGDPVEVQLQVAKIGTSSITLHSLLRDPERNIEVGKVELIHVLVDRATRKTVPIPDDLRAILGAPLTRLYEL